MPDLSIYIVFDDADEPFADQFTTELGTSVTVAAGKAGISSDHTPVVVPVSGLANIPAVSDIDPLSVVLWVIPDRPLTDPEKTAAQLFRARVAAAAAGGGTRLLPISPNPNRYKPPMPLDDLVSTPAHPKTPADLERLTNHLLILLSLRVSCENRRVFISYRQIDGRNAARELETRLGQRGYDIWRDDKADRDGLAKISPGDPAQKTIHEALSRSSVVLLIDTPQAPNSAWVNEEVDVSIGLLMPILPIVIEDLANTYGPAKPPTGGRFPAVEKLGNEVRLPYQAIDPDETIVAAAITDAKLDELESMLASVMLQHLASRRRLITETAEQFRAAHFTWKPVPTRDLLFIAESPRDSQLTPELQLRFLVQCAPYVRLLDDTVTSLCGHVRGLDQPVQYAIIVHEASAYLPERRRLMTGRGGHIIAIQPSQVSQLNIAIKF